MDIQYTGEHLLPGQIGRLSIIIAFVFALTSAVSFAVAAMRDDSSSASWKRLGRVAFFIHGVGVLGVVGALFYIIFNHYFEYHYAWQHSSLALPLKYILACFWEGQEGSFLLWTFWHFVLGTVLIFRAGKWEPPVLAVITITQVFLVSMLLGVYMGSYKVGSNPFLLLRQTMDAPIFARENYMEFITDGNGLNPLLQNYWMTIHPPTLFLGFATTIVPFAFVIASLWKKDYTGWVAQAQSWSIFGCMVLGIGILMGGAWAYESLTFGGFWAWDPVENASLVPWLIFIAGLHGLLIYKHTGRGLRFSYFLFILTFLFILYSTFLTRSGILGDTSVHSFTDLGMSGQLLFFMLFYVVLSIVFLAINWNKIPSIKEEEKIASREFWLFIGALILVLSAMQITFTTSIPVWNKFLILFRKIPFLAGPLAKDIAPPINPAQHYNSIQVWIATIIAMLSASVQFLRYKNSDSKKFFKALGIPALIALVLTAVVSIGLEIYPVAYLLLLFTSLFSIAANFDYLFIVLKGKLNVGGASVAHVGFGLILIGALIPNYKQRVISMNNQGIDYGDKFDEKNKRENILLRKGQPVLMDDYWVTYKSDSVSGPDNFYAVQYERVDKKTGAVREKFVLHPNAQKNPKMGLTANPDTRVYATHDIYTHVTSVPDDEAKDEIKTKLDTVAMGDTFYLAKAYAIFEGLEQNPKTEKYHPEKDDVMVGANVKLYTLDSKIFSAQPIYLIKDNRAIPIEDEIKELGVTLRVERILPETHQIVLGVQQKDLDNDFIIMKAIVFPYINVLWLGALMMAFGMLVSLVKRYRDNLRIFSRDKT